MRHFDVSNTIKKIFKWKTKSNQNEIFLMLHSCTWNEIFTKTKTPSVAQITPIKPSRYVNCLFASELSLFNHIFGEIFKLKSYLIVKTGQHSHTTYRTAIIRQENRSSAPIHTFYCGISLCQWRWADWYATFRQYWIWIWIFVWVNVFHFCCFSSW